MKWDIVLKNKDKKSAGILINSLNDAREKHGEAYDLFVEIIKYPKSNVWWSLDDKDNFTSEFLNPHFRRVLVELKILSLTGKTFLKI